LEVVVAVLATMLAQDQVAQRVLDLIVQPLVVTEPTPTTVTPADLAAQAREAAYGSVAVVDTGMAMAGAVMVHAVFPVIGAAVLEHDIQVENKLDQVRLEQAQVQAQLVTADQVKQPTVVWWWYMHMRKEIKWQ
jgi:hypothetical protein